MPRLANIFLFLGCVAVACRAGAHDPGLSTAAITLHTNRIEAVLGFAVMDASEIVTLDKDHDGRFSKEELIDGATGMQAAATNALEIILNGQAAAMTSAACEFDQNFNATISLHFTAGPFTNLVIRSAWLARLQPGHRQLLTLRSDSGQVLAER